MATTTRAAILRRAMSLVPDVAFATLDGVNALTMSASGGALAVIDTANQMPVGYSTNTHQNWFMVRPALLSGTAAQKAADKVRIITAYTASTNTWTTAAPNYAITPAATEPYRICKHHPSVWERALNEALRTECFFVQYDEWSPVSNTRRIYDLESAPISVTAIDRMSDILAIEVHDENETANEEDWRPWANGQRTWRTYEDDGTIYVDFGAAVPGTTQQMRILSAQPYPALTDEITTSKVDEEWAAYATLLCMARALGDPDNPADVWTEMLRKHKPQEFCRDRRRQELGKYAFRVVEKSASRGGAVSVGGRAGRAGTHIGRHGRGL